MDFGAFVRIGPGKDAEGLVHVSEVAPFRIEKYPAQSRRRQSSRYDKGDRQKKAASNLSIKAADPEFAARKGLTPSSEPNGPRRETPRPPKSF